MANQEEEVLGKAYDARLMRRLLTYLRPYGWQVVVALSAIIFKAGLDVLGPFLTKVAIDKYLSHVATSNSFLDRWLSSSPLKGIAQLAALYVGALVLSFFCDFLQTYYMQWTGQMVMFDLRSQIFRHLQRMHIGFYDRNPVGRLVTRVTTDVDALNEMFTAGVVSIFEDVFVLLGIILIMMTLNWKLALMTLAVLPFIIWATMIFRVKVRDSYRRIRVAIARINSYLQEAVSGMLVLQLFNREKRAYRQFSDINASHMVAFKDAIMAYAVYYPVVEILSQIAVATIVWFGGREVIQHVHIASLAFDFSRQHIPVVRFVVDTATIGVLFAFTQYALRFFRPIQDLSDKYNILQSAMASAERVFKLLDTPVDITSPAVTKKPEGPGRIEFDHVWFSYGVRGTAADTLHRKAEADSSSGDSSSGAAEMDWVLRDVSFAIDPGETIAVVGHTGAGKTTLISLLLRFYDVQKGAILIDGVDIKDMDLDDLRRRFGVVLQDPFLFSGTVGGNIRLGSEWIADQDVEKAAEEVNLADFIRSLPGGYGEEVRERGLDAVDRAEAVDLVCARPGPQSADSDSRRSHFERRYGNRIPGARRAEPHGRGPHVAGDRAPAVDRATRRQDHRHAQGQGPRNGHAPATARPARRLLQALPAAVQGPGNSRLLGQDARSHSQRRRLKTVHVRASAATWYS